MYGLKPVPFTEARPLQSTFEFDDGSVLPRSPKARDRGQPAPAGSFEQLSGAIHRLPDAAALLKSWFPASFISVESIRRKLPYCA